MEKRNLLIQTHLNWFFPRLPKLDIKNTLVAQPLSHISLDGVTTTKLLLHI